MSDAINFSWNAAQTVLAIACIGAVIFSMIVFLLLPFVGLYKLARKLRQRLAFK